MSELKSYKLADVLCEYINSDYQNQKAQDKMMQETHMTGVLFKKLTNILIGGIR